MRYAIVPKETKTGIVKAVHDGDSIKVQFEDGEVVWVRLYGCDAPEVISNYVTQSQPFGVDSGNKLRELLKGKTVTVETLFRDMYQRMICKVILTLKVPNTEDVKVDVTEYLIENGLAWWLGEPKMAVETKNKLQALHEAAKAKKIGFWAVSGRKVRPSTWRKDHKRFSTTKLFPELW